MPSNPFLFPSPGGGLNYSRFAQGEFGDNENNAAYTGTESTPESEFQVAPGNPIPWAFNPDIGNQLGPGIEQSLQQAQANNAS